MRKSDTKIFARALVPAQNKLITADNERRVMMRSIINYITFSDVSLVVPGLDPDPVGDAQPLPGGDTGLAAEVVVADQDADHLPLGLPARHRLHHADDPLHHPRDILCHGPRH